MPFSVKDIVRSGRSRIAGSFFFGSPIYDWGAQKRKYSKKDMEIRLTFSKRVLRLSRKELRDELGLSVDGVIFSMPPEGDVERWNHCWAGETHMWRKDDEAAKPELAGDNTMAKQVPIERALPMWCGISEGGVGELCVHKSKKCSIDEWVDTVRKGVLGGLLRKLNPKNKKRPWKVLCDGEGFLRSKAAQKSYSAHHIELWSVPPRSPDLNPIEKFWAYVRTRWTSVT